LIQYRSKHVTIFQSAIYLTTSTVIETPDMVLVVDPTWLPHEVEEIRSYVSQIRNHRPLYLLFTHSDWDHILGYGAFPDAFTIGSIEFENHPEKEMVIEQIKAYDDRNYITRNYEIIYPNLNIIVTEDGQKMTVGETTLTFYKSPGHIVDGLFTIIEPYGIYIAGDYLSDIEFPFIYYSSTEYEKTLQKAEYILQNYSIKLLIPGHGQYTDELSEMYQRQKDALDYIVDLRRAVKENNNEKLDFMIQDRPFLRNLRNYHQQNIELMRRELGL
jgi:hydroxyacylglutathione hydrolase